MALTDLSIQARMVENPGSIVENVWKGDGATTYVNGQLLKKTASGTVAPATADHATAGIHCIFADPSATAVTSDFVTIREINDDTVFECQIHHDTPASAVGAQASIGDRHPIVISSGIWGVDIETAVSNSYDCEIVDIWDNKYDYLPDADEGGQYGLAYVKISPARLELAPA